MNDRRQTAVVDRRQTRLILIATMAIAGIALAPLVIILAATGHPILAGMVALVAAGLEAAAAGVIAEAAVWAGLRRYRRREDQAAAGRKARRAERRAELEAELRQIARDQYRARKEELAARRNAWRKSMNAVDVDAEAKSLLAEVVDEQDQHQAGGTRP